MPGRARRAVRAGGPQVAGRSAAEAAAGARVAAGPAAAGLSTAVSSEGTAESAEVPARGHFPTADEARYLAVAERSRRLFCL